MDVFVCTHSTTCGLDTINWCGSIYMYKVLGNEYMDYGCVHCTTIIKSENITVVQNEKQICSVIINNITPNY